MASKRAHLKLTSIRFPSRRLKQHGLRMGTVRRLPRGVRKKDLVAKGYFDVWFPMVAPSRRLLDGSRANFTKRYLAELKRTTDSRQAIFLLAGLAKAFPISIGCYCQDEERCHRKTLKKVIEAAAAGRWP
jgi:uncharacterized protein YeaO (DUF488 family)